MFSSTLVSNSPLENGIVVFEAPNDFEVTLTVNKESGAIVWRLLDIKITFASSGETGDDGVELGSQQVNRLIEATRQKLMTADPKNALYELYNHLRGFFFPMFSQFTEGILL